jgi:uncharacterized protein
MTLDRRALGPVAISAYDLPGGHELLVHDCEDCACAVADQRALPTSEGLQAALAADDSQWTAGRDVIDWALDGEHRLLFNPLGPGGVVVVNDAAHRVFSAFRQPSTFTAAAARQQDAGETATTDGGPAAAVMRKLGELQILHPAGQPQRPQFTDGRMLTAWLHVTNACNLRCPYCYLDKTAEPMNEATGRAAVEAVLRSAVDHGFTAVKLKYAGGEASLNYRLMLALHAYARELAAQYGLELHATMLTNGAALAVPLIEALGPAGIQVMVSLDGIGDAHDAQRPTTGGKPSFRLVERGIGRLTAAGIAPHLSITITGRNAEGVAEVVRFALDRGLTFSLNLFRDNDCAASYPDLRYEEQAMIDGMLAAFAVIEEYLPRWSVLGSVLDRGQLLEQRQRSCGVGQSYVVIDQHGQVAKCHMEIEKTLGDVFRDDPLQLVRQDRSSALNLLVDEKEGCRDCTWRYWCTGGCTVATFRATGRYDVKSPNCNIYRAIYPQALRLEALRLLKYCEPAPLAGTLS